MTTKIEDYLTKQILIDKNVVTFRSLSRFFKIHVNVAKNELSAFHTSLRSSGEPAYATYLLSGDVHPDSVIKTHRPQATENGMDVDEEADGNDSEPDIAEGDVVPVTKITLVGERDLEAAKSAYLRIYSEHIYCLSPSPITDADLVCGPTQQVQKVDEKLAEDSAVSLGRITGSHVRRGKYVKPLATAKPLNDSKPTRSESRKVSDGAKEKAKEEKTVPAPEAKKEESTATPPQPKPSGKLDWSKAKPKGKGKAELSATKEKTKEVPKGKGKADQTEEIAVDQAIRGLKATSLRSEDNIATSAKVKVEKAKSVKPSPPKESSPSDQEIKRGKKRKSVLPSDSEPEDEPPRSRKRTPTPPAPTQAKSQTGAKLNGKKNVILSDDEDAPPLPRTRMMKGKPKRKPDVLEFDSDAEMSVRAMMDIDDEHVVKASTKREKRQEEPSEPEDDLVPDTEPELTSDDVIMVDDSDDEPVKKPRKRKERKVWPKGQNGLRKRRVMKSRMTTDAKGYMVTEDYSEYESVDEEDVEVEETKPKKSAAKSKKATTPTEERKSIRASDAETSRKSKPAEKPKRSGSSASNKNTQGSLKTFFGKK